MYKFLFYFVYDVCYNQFLDSDIVENVMGCWNATCGVSHLPILAGDPVVTWAIVVEKARPFKQYIGGGYSYSNEAARPLGIPIFGRYNDYGGIEHIELNEAEQAFYSHFLKLLEPVALVRPEDNTEKTVDLVNRLKGDEIDFQNVLLKGDIETFFNEAVERSDLFLTKTSVSNAQSLCIFHVHKQIYEDVVKAVLDSWTEDWDIDTEKLSKIKTHDKFKKLADEYISMYSTKKTAVSRAIFSELNHALSNFWSPDLVTNSLLQEVDPMPSSRDQVLNILVNLMAFNQALSDLRISWTPNCGAGSQSYELNLHQALNKSVGSQIRKTKQSLK